jgi:hypothetical protein
VGELIGYAWCSTVPHDLTAQREIPASLGIPPDRIYLDKGLTDTTRTRPGLDQVDLGATAEAGSIPDADKVRPTQASSAG